jgi:hypothetical protein
MKNDFAKVAQKIQLFSDHATVLTYAFGEARITSTINDVVEKDVTYDGQAGIEAILSGLAKQKIPHEIIAQDKNGIRLAVPRSKKDEAQNAIDAALRHGAQAALTYSMSQESTPGPLSPILDSIARPFSPLRREVAKSLQRLGQ